MGEPTLVEGRVVEIIDLSHLNENYDPEHELYIIEVKTGIDNIYEVRTFNQISPTAEGPISLYKSLGHEVTAANRLLKKVGVTLPNNAAGASPTLHHSQPKNNKRRYYPKRKKF